MLLTLYIVFLSLALALITIGKFSGHIDLTISGSAFLFILGIVLMLGGLQYEIGETSLSNYSYIDDDDDTIIDTIAKNSTAVYSNYDSEIVLGITINHTFGLLLAFLGGLLFMFSLFEMKKLPGFGGKNED